MKAKVLKRTRAFTVSTDTQYKIQRWEVSNDYPQMVLEIIAASGTGKACTDTYAKFIGGKGFADPDFYKLVVNRFGQTADYILGQVKVDYARLKGFALHLNFNKRYEVTEVQHVPFENIRFQLEDEETREFTQVAVHPDWGRRFTKLRRWKKEDIDFIDLFNPDPEVIEAQVAAAGGWGKWKGQIYYFSGDGMKTYPTPIADVVLTDMNTEEGIANVANRNARNNFFPAGIFINYKSPGGEDSGDEAEFDTDELEQAILDIQGDENAGKILYAEAEDKESAPEFKPMNVANYDKQFEVTCTKAQKNIGRAYNQPPILRCEDVGASFGAELLKNAFNYYNAVTVDERQVIERVFSEIFNLWTGGSPAETYEVYALSYDVEMTLAEKVGKDEVARVLEICNGPLPYDRKRAVLKVLYYISDSELDALVPTDEELAATRVTEPIEEPTNPGEE